MPEVALVGLRGEARDTARLASLTGVTKQVPLRLETGGVVIGDKVTIHLEIEAVLDNG